MAFSEHSESTSESLQKVSPPKAKFLPHEHLEERENALNLSYPFVGHSRVKGKWAGTLRRLSSLNRRENFAERKLSRVVPTTTEELWAHTWWEVLLR